MPLWAPYDKLIKSNIADVNHIAEGSFAGSMIAALFLRRFVKDAKRFAHLDIFAWGRASSPGALKAAIRKARARCSPISVRNSGRDEPRDYRRAALVAANSVVP